ncbi:hypothetical protein [Psychrobacter maritimus]|uniref:hypothetical protein n=1 Tax=Psychrobacter maritimus TaxID=256325 RepID=UPI0039B1011E
MDITTIAKLQKEGLLLSPLVVDLFKIYTEHIRPVIDSDNLKLEQRRALFKPTLIVKSDKKQLLANNFELYHLIKSHNLDQDTLKQNVLVSSLTEEESNLGIAFFELIEITSRYKAILDLSIIYTKLNNILTKDMTQKLFKKNIFSIITFCTLIGITDRAYHARNTGSV